MPPRLLTAAIVLGWLTTTSMLVYRELAPRFQAGQPPPFTIPLTAEVGDSVVNWNVLQKDQPVGSGHTQIKMQPGRIFALSADFKLDKLKIFVEFEKVKMTAVYRVTEDGRLLSGSAKIILSKPFPAEIVFKGEVRDRMFHPTLAVLVDGRDINPFPPEPVPVSESGSILNPMHLVHKISGLRAGRSWVIPLMDPLRAAPSAAQDLLPVKTAAINQVVATVTVEDLPWHHMTVPCFKIAYAKPGERPLAATWVRRRDDAVLQQWASYEGIEYTLQRQR